MRESGGLCRLRVLAYLSNRRRRIKVPCLGRLNVNVCKACSVLILELKVLASSSPKLFLICDWGFLTKCTKVCTAETTCSVREGWKLGFSLFTLMAN